MVADLSLETEELKSVIRNKGSSLRGQVGT